MVKIEAEGKAYVAINDEIHQHTGEILVTDCCGQRFIGAGMGNCTIKIQGIPGNALGAYLNGGEIEVFSNAQDSVGDTMNAGRIVVHGNIGDTAGYAMRGGEIYVKGNAGYRTGIHMKAYQDKLPVIVIGGTAGSFLGEYQAGGIIIVLGLNRDGKKIVSNYPCTGMHGGKLFLCSDCQDVLFPKQVTVHTATDEDMQEIAPYLEKFSDFFGMDLQQIRSQIFTVVTPDSQNPYKQMYVTN
ncbi:MAG TPA: glutamate synthase [Candidatus Faecousia faecavium]|nr:glutamate synthase [Candidatus Faecousia faecavium]